MPELLPPSLFDRLGKLARLFVWRRKSLHDDIVEDLYLAGTRHETLAGEHQDTLARLQRLTQEHGHLTERLVATDAELAQTRQDSQSLQHTLDMTRAQHQRDDELARMHFDSLAARHSQIVVERNAIELAHQAIEQMLEEARKELGEKSAALIALQQALAQAQDVHQKLATEFNALEQRHGDTWTRFQLISRLLAARPTESAGLTRFRQLLAKDYMAFAESDSSLAAEAKALLMLQSIEQELGLLVGVPDVFKRTIVGIVGGFSSGKSEFINSFILDHEIRLAVGLQPVTAIPSYVLATDESLIRGYSGNGGYIELGVEFYKSISHAFINSFSFDLKSLMPFMCVGIQMDPAYFSNICFIDTPGYNPPATAGECSQSDKATAVQFAQQSGTIVWLIGLDVTGTVPNSDLKFIQEIGVEHRSVYVVLNKADLKPEDDLEFIMDEVESVLTYENIPIVGISAYSSTLRRIFTHRGQPLMDYFARINQQSDARKHLEGQLKEAFDMYEEAIQSGIAANRQQKLAINGLKLDALEIGGAGLYEKMLETIAKLDQKLDTAPLEKSLKESRRMLDAFTDAIQQTTESLEEKASVASGCNH